jgi:hypothetical protein
VQVQEEQGEAVQAEFELFLKIITHIKNLCDFLT